MHHPHTKYTIEIFKRTHDNLPPLIPSGIKEEMVHALEHFENDYTIGSDEVENSVIALGKKIWAYWKAFSELYNINQGKLGEKFLLGKLTPPLKKKYRAFKEHGGDYHDLRTGGPIDFFETKDRLHITKALVEVDKDIQSHTQQAVMTTDRKKYEDLIIDFQETLDNIEKRLDTLRLMAEDEEEHPSIAEEIREQVKTFEFGLCLLGPNTNEDDLHESEEYYFERRATKKLYRF